jgi:hypothetical protein
MRQDNGAEPQPYEKVYNLAPHLAPQEGQTNLRRRYDTASDLLFLGGAEGIRTPDPLHAMEVRYQLRYSPVNRIYSAS